MCGITGFLNPNGFRADEAGCIVAAMSDRLRHRGPDDAGAWVDGAAGVALGHRRLSILDLSPAGHQPMVSPSGRFVIVFNGEIYNHADLRRDLDARGDQSWRGHSDTETLLALIDREGVETAIKATVGMFALAVWDRKQRVLSLARDRMGEKPLYYGWQGETFLFASELKALDAHPDFRGEIDRGVLPLYLRHGYVPAPYSIFRGIGKLPPGCMARLSSGDSIGSSPCIENYWSLRRVAEAGIADPFQGSDEDAIAELERLLRQAIAGQQVADVPLGAFLSGGTDSSAVVALMQTQSSQPVRTFTIGFHEPGFNEAEHAKAVANHLGVDHTELYVTPGDALNLIPRLATLYDEPFGDVSAIPTFLVAQLARRHVTVALSGDGGDELFSGYNRYSRTASLWAVRNCVPRSVRRFLAYAVDKAPVAAVDFASALVPTRRRRPPGDQRAALLAQYLRADDFESFYRPQMSLWNCSPAIAGTDSEPASAFTNRSAWLRRGGPYERMMYLDSVAYLPDDILVKVDRASMGVSLETRVPLLDHRVVEFAWRLPLGMKRREGKGKWLLRQVLYRYVPPALVDRPKAGFACPIGAWIRGQLRDWAEDLLSPHRLDSDGFFASEAVRRCWRKHVAGQAEMGLPLWQILIFQAWGEAQRGQSGDSDASAQSAIRLNSPSYVTEGLA